MNYRIIPKDMLVKLSNREAYTFCCILLNTDRETYTSHIRQDTLVSLTGYCEKTIKTYIRKFEALGLLRVETNRIRGEKGYFNRNTCHVIKPDINYFRVEYDFLFDKIPSDIKGYLLLLKCICYGGTNSTLYSLNVMAEKKLLQIGLSKMKELNREAVSLGMLSKYKSGYTITNPNIYADTAKEKIPASSDCQEYYNQIAGFCRQCNVNPPRYDAELMKVICYNCPASNVFVGMLANKGFTVRNIRSLAYFIRIFNFKYPCKAKGIDYKIVL